MDYLARSHRRHRLVTRWRTRTISSGRTSRAKPAAVADLTSWLRGNVRQVITQVRNDSLSVPRQTGELLLTHVTESCENFPIDLLLVCEYPDAAELLQALLEVHDRDR